MRTAFKAYDIRGIFGKDFTGEDVYRIGYFLPGLLNADKVLIGMDVRISSRTIYENLSRGITDAGADVDFCGHTTTPMIYWATAKYGYNASAMITASHNPAQYNGLKVSGRDALPVGYDTGLSDLLELAEIKVPTPTETKGTIRLVDISRDYLEFLKPYIPNLTGLKIAVDCSNGMGSLLIRKLLGNSPLYLFEEPDGTFPNHEPNPLEEENVADLSRTVKENNCDVGAIFDGDADRVMFVDERGVFIQPDMMIALLAGYFASKGIRGKCLQDIRTSKSVTRYVEALGYPMHIWRVGRAYAAMKLREIDGLFGGELAGHYYFRDFYYSDSAYLAALILLGEIKRAKENGISLSQLIAGISIYHGSGEINLKIENKSAAMKALIDFFTQEETPEKIMDFDGYRLEFRHWWFNIRPSNTEPYLRLIMEAETASLLEEKKARALKVLEEFK
ncbi:MAG TPA: phosphomannomutase/phosphoglucomutase [Lentimicrobium sp.]|nr:phosphomannomutase/phosphoglucomutase [Lentimicrobium sp.]